MKHLIFRNRVLLICLILTLVCNCFGCSKEYFEDATEGSFDIHEETFDLSSSDYSLKSENGEHYICFHDEAQYAKKSSSQLATVIFSSTKEFKDTVVKGKLSDDQKAVIASSFPRSVEGRIKICDFSNLQEPNLPSDTMVDGVSWAGDSYSFSFVSSSDVFGFFFYYDTKEQYEKIYKEEYEGFFERDNITITKIEESNEKVTTYYSTSASESKKVRYTLKRENKTVTVEETYRLKMSDSIFALSDTVPSNVKMYCVEDGKFYVISISGLRTAPNEEWLLSYGIKKYVEDN